ncbi:MAG: hypothetical protein IK138_03385 [Lachnospiraceae bacterium]|nr:hypothetical protein [Lachnospiraceae bacterium]
MSETMIMGGSKLLSDKKQETTPEQFGQIQTDVKEQVTAPGQYDDRKQLITTNEIPDIDIDGTDEVSVRARQEFRRSNWTEDTKQELFGSWFTPFFDEMPLEQREKAASAVSRLKNCKQRFENRLELLLEGCEWKNTEKIVGLKDRLAQAVAKWERDLLDTKASSQDVVGHGETAVKTQVDVLTDHMDEVSERIESNILILERVKDILGEDLTEEEKDRVLRKIDSVSDSVYTREEAERVLDDLHTALEVGRVTETAQELIERENGVVEQLEAEEKAIKDKDLPEREVEKLNVRYEHATVEEYIPQSALGKISDFHDFRGEKITGVGKATAFFDKKRLRGTDLQNRMEKHVRRFLSSRNGVSEDGIANMGDVLIESSGVFTDKGAKEVTGGLKEKMDLISALWKLQEGTAIRSELIRGKAYLSGADAAEDAVPLDGEFFELHPKAAKVVAIKKLLGLMGERELSNAPKELRGRIEALRFNISLLYDAVISSPAYKNEIDRQQLVRIGHSINAHKDRIERLKKRQREETAQSGDTANVRNKAKKLTDDENKAVSDAQEKAYREKEEARLEAERQEKARLEAERLAEEARLEAERLAEEARIEAEENALLDSQYAQLSKEEEREQESEDYRRRRLNIERKISGLRRSTEEGSMTRFRSLTLDLSSVVVEEKKDSMAQGAQKYLEILLKDGFLKEYKDEEHDYQTVILTRILANVSRMFSDKGEKLEDCKAEEIRELARYYGALFSNEVFKENWKKGVSEKNENYRSYLLDKIFMGESFVTLEVFKTTVEAEAAKADGYLSHCKNFSFDKENVTLRIADLEKSTALDKHIRAVTRVRRMKGLRKFVVEMFGEDAPMSIYEYKKSKGDYITTGEGKKEKKELVSDIRDPKWKKAYENYLDTHFNGKTIKAPGKFEGESYGSIRKITKLIKDYYSEYGADVSIQKAVDRLPDTINKKANEEYLSELLAVEEKLIKEEEERQILSEQVSQETNKIKKIDDRIYRLKKVGDSRTARLVDMLIMDPSFKRSLVTDADSEFEKHASEIEKRCEEVLAAMKKHIYVDQYFIEKRSEIVDYIMHRSGTADITGLLNLKAFDKAINDKEITYKDGKRFIEVQFGAYVGAMLQAQSDISQEDATQKVALAGSAVADLLAEFGGSKLLLTNIAEEKEKVLNNLKALDITINQLKSAYEFEGLDLSEEAIKMSLHQLERNNMLKMPTEEFLKGLTERLQGELETLREEEERVQITTRKMTALKDTLFEISAQKEKGREAIGSYFGAADKMYDGAPLNVGSVRFDPDYRRYLRTIIEKKEDYTSDPFVEPLYTSTLKRMIAHAVGKDKDGFFRDVYVFEKMRAFGAAVDVYISNTYDKGEGKNKLTLPQNQRALIKRELSGYFGEELVSADNTEIELAEFSDTAVTEHFRSLIDKLASEKINGVPGIGFVVEGSFEAVGSDTAQGESKQSADTRHDFEEKLGTLIKDKKLGIALPDGEEEKLLFEHLLMKRTETGVLRDVVALINNSVKEDSLEKAAEEKDILQSYIRGDSITASPVDIDYGLIYKYASENPEQLTRVLKEVESYKVTKEENLQVLKSAVPESEDKINDIINGMHRIMTLSDKYKNELKADVLLDGKEKLWRFYTVLRSYNGTLDEYRRYRESVSDKDKTPQSYNNLQDSYALLQAFFTPGMTDDAVINKVFESGLCRDLGIYEGMSEATERREAEEKWESAQKGLIDYLSKATGEEAVVHSTELLDREEQDYSKETLAGVKMIDRWIIENTGKWGDSEAEFVMEILSRPIRERLFLYYTIEKDTDDSVSGLDAAVAVNVYVPDFKKFTSSMRRHSKLIRNAAASLAKQIGAVKGKGYIDAYGLVKTKKLEGAMRRLDYDGKGVTGNLRQLAREKRIAERIAQEARKQENPALTAIVTRDTCYKQLLKAAEAQREFLKENGEKAKDSPEFANLVENIKRAARLLRDADAGVKQYYLDMKSKETSALEPEKDKEQEPEESGFTDIVEDVGEVSDTVGKIAEKINPYDSDTEEYKYTLPWGITDKVSEFLDHAEGICSSIGTLTSFIGAVVAIKETVENKHKFSATGNAEQATEAVDKVSEFVKNTADFLSYVAPATKEVASTVSGIAGGMVGITTGLVKWVTSSVNYATVTEAEQQAKEKAVELEETTQDKTAVTTKNGLSLSEAVEKVANIQKRMTQAESINAALDFTGGVFAIMEVAAPLAAPIFGAAQGAVAIVKAIHSFWANKDQREKTIDEYIGMDDLIAKYAEITGSVAEADKTRLGENDELRRNLRRMALRHMHYSTMEEFFGEITKQYATLLYGQIFFENGNPILAGDTEKIQKRESLCKLFPGLNFEYPVDKEAKPSPTIEEMTGNLIREAK